MWTNPFLLLSKPAVSLKMEVDLISEFLKGAVIFFKFTQTMKNNRLFLINSKNVLLWIIFKAYKAIIVFKVLLA